MIAFDYDGTYFGTDTTSFYVSFYHWSTDSTGGARDTTNAGSRCRDSSWQTEPAFRTKPAPKKKPSWPQAPLLPMRVFSTTHRPVLVTWMDAPNYWRRRIRQPAQRRQSFRRQVCRYV